EGEDAGGDDERRDGEEDALTADEIERRLAVVQPVAEAALLGHQVASCMAPGAARPRATPTHRASVKIRLRPSSTTMGRVKKYAVTRPSWVDSPRTKEYPRRPPRLNA